MRRLEGAWTALAKDPAPVLRLVALALALRFLIPHVRIDRLAQWLTPQRVRPAGAPRQALENRPAGAPRQALENPRRLADLQRWAERVGRAASWPKSGACLIISLLQYRLLRGHGFPVVFHCGVRRAEGRIQGHAWLVHDGRPILREGELAGRYTSIFCWPPGVSSPATVSGDSPPAAPRDAGAGARCASLLPMGSPPVDPSAFAKPHPSNAPRTRGMEWG